ncbi:GNAT family N-acetyltransferase [Agrobacterium tumefaciens]|nr:GNAT family N-acetyltransferase [Agrobacterium tumefaciens]NTE22315.1 GNAT family N-acetyltransferase [Agrobacterium tumefaciens]
MIIYQSKTIVIREFLPSEEYLFISLFEDKEVTRFLPQLHANDYHQLFEMALKDYDLGSFGRWGIFDAKNELFIGTCLYRPFVEVPEQTEIGYSLIKSYWGMGIGTEVAKALLSYGFAKTKTNEIVALTDLRNIGSQKVLQKLGFKQLNNIIRRGVELSYFLIERSEKLK